MKLELTEHDLHEEKQTFLDFLLRPRTELKLPDTSIRQFAAMTALADSSLKSAFSTLKIALQGLDAKFVDENHP